jgi:hypothetical protein
MVVSPMPTQASSMPTVQSDAPVLFSLINLIVAVAGPKSEFAVATRRQHTLTSVVAFRQTAGQLAKRMTDFGGQQ